MTPVAVNGLNHGDSGRLVARCCEHAMYPLVNIQKAIENGPVEIVDLPINSMVDLSIVFC